MADYHKYHPDPLAGPVKLRDQSRAAAQAGGGAELQKLITQLKDGGYAVQQCTPYHLKIGPVNYFRTTGKITTDPDIKHPEKGFEALLALLEKVIPKRPSIFTVVLK